MSLAISQLKHAFGLRTGVNGAIGHQNEQTLVYPCGSNLVLYNIEQKTQKFIPGLEKSPKMTAMAISPNRRYVALAETRHEDRPVMIIYDLNTMRRKKVLSCPEGILTSEFVSVAFSPDSRYLASQTDGPDWALGYWGWDKSKLLAGVKLSSPHNFSVNQISFNPQDSTQLCVVGNCFFKMFRYSEGSLKTFGIMKVEIQNFMCHAWVSDERLVLGTDKGKWMLIENGEIKMDYKFEFEVKPSVRASVDATSGMEKLDAVPIDARVTSIVSTKKGIAVACGLGKVHWFDLAGEKDYYKKGREIIIPMDTNSADPTHSQSQVINDMCVSPSENYLIVSTDIHQLYIYSLNMSDLAKYTEISQFDLLAYSFHHGQILGLDLCLRKPIIATCALDRSVRIWNYESNQLELYKEFAEEAFSIALHPSGLYILVGFSDKLRLMNILIDDIRTFKEFPIRGCKECAFSNGGHYFAAVQNNVILIYSVMNFELAWSLKGHNGKVRNLVWTNDDKKLISCGMDGAVYEWDIFSGSRIAESVLKSCSYTGITVTPDGKTTFAVGTDKSVKEISDSSVVREVSNLDTQMTTVAISNSGRMLYCGTSTGAVRSFKFPLSQTSEWREFMGHSAQITKMKLTNNDDFLVTIGDDCSVMIWKLQDKEGRTVKRDKDTGWAEEILITKSDLEDKNLLISELKTRVEELKMENEYQLRLKDMNYSEKIKELTEKFVKEMEALKMVNQMLQTEKDKEEALHEAKLQEIMEKHNTELQDIEESNKKNLTVEMEKFSKLEDQFSNMQSSYETKIAEMETEKEKAIEQLSEYFEEKLLEKGTIVENLTKDVQDQTMEYEETKRLIEEDADREILETKIKYERKLREERESNAKLKGETGIMKKKFASFQREIEDQKEEIRKYQNETQKLENALRNLEKEKVRLKKEIQERDETIQDKEKRIYDLKKKNQELDKFKFVLDYKVKELKKQIEPKDVEIQQHKDQIQEMEAELERFNKQINLLTLNIDALKQKLKSAERELRHERVATRDVEVQIRRFKADFYNCTAHIQNPRDLKRNVIALFKKHIQEDASEASIERKSNETNVNADIHAEFERQRDHLERSVTSLRQKLVRDSELNRADYIRIMQENVSLINEINDLRKVLKEGRAHIHDLDAALTMFKKLHHMKNIDTESQKELKAIQVGLLSPTAKSIASLEKELIEAERTMDIQRTLILHLKNQIGGFNQKYDRGELIHLDSRTSHNQNNNNNNNNNSDNNYDNDDNLKSGKLPPIHT